MRIASSIVALSLLTLPACATAQTAQTAPGPSPSVSELVDAAPQPQIEPSPMASAEGLELPMANEFCIAQMTALAGGTLEGRHQLFVLVREAGRGADDDFMAALEAFGMGEVDPATPILQVVEDIANPVLLQAAPSATIGQMGHLIRFSNECGPLLDGQIEALEATSPGLGDGAYKQAIGEDAMFLRSILLDAFYRMNVDVDPVHGLAIAAYQNDLVDQRDEIEFAAFDAELAALENEYAGDLENRLGLANAAVGESAEAVDAKGAAAVAKALTDVQRAEANQRMARILFEILNGYS